MNTRRVPLTLDCLVAPVWERQRAPDGTLEEGMWFYRFDAYYLRQGAGRSLTRAYNAWRVAEKAMFAAAASAGGSWHRARADFLWDARADAWDADQRLVRIAADVEARQAMLRRHLGLGLSLQTLGGAALRHLAALAQEKAPEDMSISEIRHTIDLGVRMERQARGYPDWMVAAAAMTDDELRERWSQALRGLLPEDMELRVGPPQADVLLGLPARDVLDEDQQ